VTQMIERDLLAADSIRVRVADLARLWLVITTYNCYTHIERTA
jgi:hypothetical protein